MNGKPFEGEAKTGSFAGFALDAGRWTPLVASWASPTIGKGAAKIERDV
jgi:hypothetical protein